MNKICLLIAIIGFIISTIAFASPTFKNCGNPGIDGACSDTACRIDFDNTAVTNCEMDFATPPINGWRTDCWSSNPKQIDATVSNDYTHINFSPTTSTPLAGKHEYVICTQQTIQGR